MPVKLPKNWRKVHLVDISTQPQYGWTTKSQSTGTIRYLRTTDISSKKINWEKVPYCLDLPQDLQPFLLERNDIVISRAGSVGLSHIVQELPGKTVFASYLIRFKPILVDAKYVFYFLQSAAYWDHISKSSAGIAVQNVNATKLSQIVLPLAPLPEQKRISTSLDTLYESLDIVQSRLDNFPKLIAELRQQIFKYAINGSITKEWRKNKNNYFDAKIYLKSLINERITVFKKEKKNNSLLPEYLVISGIKQSTKVPIPQNWTKTYFRNLGELTRGRSKNRPRNDPKLFNGKYPFIQTGNIADSFVYIRSHRQTYNENGLAQSRLFPKGTLCITIAANIADTGILTYPACFPDSVVGFIPFKKRFLPEIALYYIKVIKQELEELAPATAQKNINVNILSQLPIPVPPIQEQREIVKRARSLFRQIDKMEKTYWRLKKTSNELPQAILSKAYSGKLVSQNSKDEPVEKLLERIREEKARLFEERKEESATRRSVRKTKKEVKIMEIIELLEINKRMAAKDLWKQSKYKDDIDRFYAQLKILVNVQKKVREIKEETVSYLELMP